MHSGVDEQQNSRLFAPEYDEAWLKVLYQATQGIVFQDSVFGMLRRIETSHSGPIRNVRSPQPLDQPYSGAQFSATMHEDDLRQTKIDKHTDFIIDMAEAAKKEMGPQLFQSIAEMTAASDMDFDAGGQPFSAEMYLKTLEKMDIDFDDDGQPHLPTLVVPPTIGEATQRAVKEAEQSPRYNDILTRKRDEYFAKKRTRRLS